MKRPTRLLIASGILASATMLSAHAERSVEVKDHDGNVAKTPLTVGTHISFGETGIDIINEGESPVSFQYLNISSISFGQGSGVNAIQAGTSLRLASNPVGDILRIYGFESKTAPLSISSLNGTSMLSIRQWKGEDINVSHLNPGIYLLTINNNTIKFIKK